MGSSLSCCNYLSWNSIIGGQLTGLTSSSKYTSFLQATCHSGSLIDSRVYTEHTPLDAVIHYRRFSPRASAYGLIFRSWYVSISLFRHLLVTPRDLALVHIIYHYLRRPLSIIIQPRFTTAGSTVKCRGLTHVQLPHKCDRCHPSFI